MSNHKISKEMIHPNVKELVTEDLGDITKLETTNKNNIVEALNELVSLINEGKKTVVDVIGDPLLITDKWSEIGNKLSSLTDEFAMLLTKKGVVDIGLNETIPSLISKINSIKTDGGVTKTVISNNYLMGQRNANPCADINNIYSTSYTKVDEITLLTEGSIRYENKIKSMYQPGKAVSFKVSLVRNGVVIESKEFSTTTDLVVVHDFNNIKVGDKITGELKCFASSSCAACLWGVLKGDIVK